MSNGSQTTSPLVAILGYQLDTNQFKLVESVVDSLERLTEAVVRAAPPAIYLQITDMESGFTVTGANITMNLKNDQQVRVRLVVKNRRGGPAKLQAGSVQWSANAATGAFTVEADPNDEMSALVKGNPESPGGPEDLGTVNVKFDADASEGIKEKEGQGAVNVIAGDANISELEFDTPEDQPEVTPTPTPAPAPPTP